MTKKEVDEVLHYVAKEIISPLHRDKRTGDEIWDEMIGVPFNKFVTFMHNMIKEENKNEISNEL